MLNPSAIQNAILETGHVAIVATNEKGVVELFNAGAERMLGYTAAEVVGHMTSAELFVAEEKDEITYLRKDGKRMPAIGTISAVWENDAITGYLLIATDNKRLRDEQFYTRSLIDSNIEGVITTDPFGLITDMNHQMEAITGCTLADSLGTHFKNYFTDADRAAAAIDLVLLQGSIINYELTACTKQGRETVLSFNATTLLDREGELKGVFAAARDVTERKRLDRALLEQNIELERARAAAEDANAAKSEFLSSMSHELRSPLNAILGFAQLLHSDSPPPTPAQASNIEQILHAGWYLLALINEILDLARIESRKLAMSAAATSLGAVMNECQAMIETQAKKRGISTTFPTFDAPCYVLADRTRLKQILLNLLSNAVKYNHAGGTVVVECMTPAPERIRISVRDSGAGLPPELLAQLFTPFNRLGQEKGSKEGTGIGLVMSKRLVELMGGTIGVESTVGAGSVFWFELKLTDSPAPTTDAPKPAATFTQPVRCGTEPRTLLYVEDNEMNLMLVEQLIARRPEIHLLSAMDGERGVELARTEHPDVILMDINLPGMSGFDALKILREDPATSRIPVVAISANAMPSDVDAGMEAGFFAYLAKPIKIKEFMESLDVALEYAAIMQRT